MKSILDYTLEGLSPGWQVCRLYLGSNWTISVVQNEAGQCRAGLAATPLLAEHPNKPTLFQPGDNTPPPVLDAVELAGLVQSMDPLEAAAGLATLNALLSPDPALVKDIDAADWLVEHGCRQKVALVGRFPFIDELRPVVSQLWVLELAPQPGEYSSDQAPEIIPQADLIAITGSTLVNHTLDGILSLVRPEARVMLLGPSTPLTPILFDFGVDLLSGVEVVDIEMALASVIQGVTFRHMQGVRRVTMQKP
jgi:uncharacterized protein (DUF4213/DUF364 family)